MRCDIEPDIVHKNQGVYTHSFDWIEESKWHSRFLRIAQTTVFDEDCRDTFFEVDQRASICLVRAIFGFLFGFRKGYPHVDGKPLESFLCRWKLQRRKDIQFEIMDVEEIDTLVIMVDGKGIEREVKEIFEMRSDRSLNLRE